MWIPELRGVGRGGGKEEGGVSLGGDQQQSKQQPPSPESLMGIFQAWRIADEEKERLGLKGVEWVEKPLIRINFSVNRRGGGGKRGGGGGGGPGGSSRGNGRGGRGGGGRGGKGKGERGGREARSGMMEKAGWQS
jgi:deoxyribodipyrimidine photo-lyase